MDTIYRFNALKNLVKCMSNKELTVLLFLINVDSIPQIKVTYTCNAAILILHEFTQDDLNIVNIYLSKLLNRNITKEFLSMPVVIHEQPSLSTQSLTERLNAPLDQFADPADDELYETTVNQLDKDLEHYMKKGQTLNGKNL